MPSPVPLADMIASVRNNANIENFTGVVSDPNIIQWINEGLQEFHDEQVQARGMEPWRKSVSFTTQPNQSAYPVPDDFFELLSLDVYIAPNQVLTARPYMEPERNKMRWYPGWVWWLPVYFRLLGSSTTTGATLQPSTLNFIPAPQLQATFTANYIPAFRKFAKDGTENKYVVDGFNGWENMAVWYATACALEKLEQNSEFAQARVMHYKERIEALASERHAGDPERIHDVFVDYDMFGLGNPG